MVDDTFSASPPPAPDGRPAADPLFAHVYDELRRLSQARIAAEPGAVTLSATGLVHEAYLKLAGAEGWADRGHVLAVASRAMRQVLCDRARARNAAKRGGPARAVTLIPGLDVGPDDPEDAAVRVLALDAALDRLAQRDTDLARIVELRFFGGLDTSEAADVLGVSRRTATRLWTRARAYLHAELD